MSNGDSSPSLLAIWRVAVRVPMAVGQNATVKVVLPPGASAPASPLVFST